MLLEECGKLLFFKIRPVFFFAMIAMPFILAGFFLSREASRLQTLKERFAAAARKEQLAMERKHRKERFIHRYSHTNPYFLDQVIESLPLLQAEREKIDSLLNHPAFPESTPLKERLSFIRENRLAFREEKIETSKEMKEIQEVQQHPVQMDETDLKQILALVEDIPIEGNFPKTNAPQLLIKDFRLKKLETPLYTEVFEVEMDLIKREFFEP